MNELATIERALVAYQPKMAQLLAHTTLAPERLTRTVMVALETNPALAKASTTSIIRAAMSACVLGLEVDGVSGQGYIVPFRGQAQFLCGYRGFVTLAARAGRTLEGHVVYEGDEFDYDEGADSLTHRWHLDARRDRVIGAYAKSRGVGMPTLYKVMGLSDLVATRDGSAGYKGQGARSPWATHFASMARKTAMRTLASHLPVLALHQASALDAQHDQGRYASLDPEGGGVVVEGEVLEVHEVVRPAPAAINPMGPVTKLQIIWPGGVLSEPFDVPRYAKVLARAFEKADAPTAQQLMHMNKEGIDGLPLAQHAQVSEAFEKGSAKCL